MTRLCFLAALLATLALPAVADPSRIPLLPAGHHSTFETGFNISNPRVVRRAIRQAQDVATEAGMTVKPLEIGWPDVEPREGRYRLGEFESTLRDYAERGWRPLVFVRAVDSDDITIPEYLKGTDEAVSLSEFDVSAPRVIQRYNALMDQVVPLVRQYGGFAIMVANEPDNFLNPNPSLTPRVVNFVTAARAHIRAIDPDMSVGVALSNGFDYDDDRDRLRAPLAHHRALIDATDIGVFNMYCRPVSGSRQVATVRERVQSRLNAAAGKDVIFQEVGCPSGGAEGLSLDHQRAFFNAYFATIRGTRVRVSVVFQLVDWTQETIEFYGRALQPILESEPAFRDNPNLIFVFLDQLSSIGIIDASTGEPKPAWAEFMNALRND